MESFTTAELVDLWYTGEDLVDQVFEYWLSVSFAVIVACFIGKNNLNTKMRVLISLLYIFSTAMFTFKYLSFMEPIYIIWDEINIRGVNVGIFNPWNRPTGIARFVVYILGACTTVWFIFQNDKNVNQIE